MDRELILRYKGRISDRQALPGEGPQGTRLVFFFFLILINAAGYELLTENMGQHITQRKDKRERNPKYP